MRYNWPGNVRELKSAFEYAFVACQGRTITPENLPRHIVEGGKPAAVMAPTDANLDELKKERLIKALERSGGNRSEAARRLGISRTSVWNQIKRYHIDLDRAVK
jgi:transcriptional regulator of acetoin/glycerol metabolism